MLPNEPTTPQQWQVIAWTSIVLCLGLAGIGFSYSLAAPAEVAAELRWNSLGFGLVAATVYATKRAVESVLRA